MAESDALSAGTPPGLRMVWWEREFPKDPVVEWGQVAGAVHRLLNVFDGLQRAAARRDLLASLSDLVFCLENYYTRVYELRERAVALAEAVAGVKLGAAKDPRRRTQALADLHGKSAMLAEPLAALLQLLDSDVSIRNEHTHSQFMELQYVVAPDEMYEPESMIVETSSTKAGRAVRRVIRRDIEKLALEHSEKVLRIRDSAWPLLEAVHAIIMGRTA